VARSDFRRIKELTSPKINPDHMYTIWFDLTPVLGDVEESWTISLLSDSYGHIAGYE
jgi:hypothetical protein